MLFQHHSHRLDNILSATGDENDREAEESYFE